MIDRRSFARVLSIGGAAVAFSAQSARRPQASQIIKPKRLAPGDTVGLVLPASAVFERDSINIAREQLEALGFKVRLGQHVYDRYGYLAGRDEDRAADINAMFADDTIAGVVCYTGGWGSPRLLPMLDYALIARKPKVLIGYSDITALLIAVHQRTGLVTFHGPTGSSTLEPFTIENYRRVVMTAEPAGALGLPPKKPELLVDKTNRIIRIAGGKASGRLIGGNLTMIASTMGTPFEIETDGAVLFLEDTHEELYRVDRMLTQLALAGKLSRAAAVLFGRCTDCNYTGPTFSLEEILTEKLGRLGIPALSGLSFGHIDQKLVLPLGVRATVDGDAGTVALDEAAVV